MLCRPENASEVKTGCSAVGSVLRSGRRGRKFESSHPDKRKMTTPGMLGVFFLVIRNIKCLQLKVKDQ